jgi:hypothetical protein
MSLDRRLRALEKDRPGKIAVVYVEPKSGRVLFDSRSNWTRLFHEDDGSHMPTGGAHLDAKEGTNR